MPGGYDPYGDALPSYGNGVPNDFYSWGLPSGGGGGSSAPGGGGGFDPTGFVGPLVSGGGNFLSSLFGMINQNKQLEKNRQLQRDLAAQADANSRDLSQQRTAQVESTLDPFRQQMAQGGDLAKLDRLERSSLTPVRVNAAGGPGAPFGQSGGYSYSKSPELVSSAAALKKSIMAGNGAPTMTNPNNYGKTSALDLIGVANGSKDPTSPNAFATGAPSAGTSQTSSAANVIRQAYREYLGRDPSDMEILSQTGNGQFTVNDPRLQLSLENIKNSPEVRARRTGFAPSYSNAYAPVGPGSGATGGAPGSGPAAPRRNPI